MKQSTDEPAQDQQPAKRSFLYFFFVWLVIGSYFLMTIEKGDAILFFNQNRSDFWDFFFIFVTKLGEEGIYIVLILGSLFVRFRYSILFLLTGISVTIVAFLAKSFFQYDRPFTFFTKKGMIEEIDFIEGVHILKGTTSFPSGHTMSAFAVYGLLYLLLRKRWWGLPIFIVALLVGLSRVYLVHHFLMDIYLGSILGLMIAYLLYFLNRKIAFGQFQYIEKRLKDL